MEPTTFELVLCKYSTLWYLFMNISINLLQTPVLSSEEVIRRVLPALITLAGDPDSIVKTASIQAFGNVALANAEDKAVSGKGYISDLVVDTG